MKFLRTPFLRRDLSSFFKPSLKSSTNDRFIKDENCTKIKNLLENFFVSLFFCFLRICLDLRMISLSLTRQRSLSYRNQSNDLLCKSMHWFLYDRDLRHKKLNGKLVFFWCRILTSIEINPPAFVVQSQRWKHQNNV